MGKYQGESEEYIRKEAFFQIAPPAETRLLPVRFHSSQEEGL